MEAQIKFSKMKIAELKAKSYPEGDTREAARLKAVKAYEEMLKNLENPVIPSGEKIEFKAQVEDVDPNSSIIIQKIYDILVENRPYEDNGQNIYNTLPYIKEEDFLTIATVIENKIIGKNLLLTEKEAIHYDITATWMRKYTWSKKLSIWIRPLLIGAAKRKYKRYDKIFNQMQKSK